MVSGNVLLNAVGDRSAHGRGSLEPRPRYSSDVFDALPGPVFSIARGSSSNAIGARRGSNSGEADKCLSGGILLHGAAMGESRQLPSITGGSRHSQGNDNRLVQSGHGARQWTVIGRSAFEATAPGP